MKIIIAGGRDFEDFDLLRKVMDTHFVGVDVEVVSGGARGADRLGERYSHLRECQLTVFNAEWTKLGKSAGPIRNQKMAEFADMAVVFWNGISRGAKNMIQECQSRKLPYLVIPY